MNFENYIIKIGIFIFILVVGYFVSIFVDLFLNRLEKIAEKTKNKLDDIVISAIKVPLKIIIILFFLYLGFYLTLPIQYINLVENAIKFIFILILTYTSVKILDKLFDLYVKPIIEKTDTKLDDHLAKPLKKILKILLYLLGILTALSSIGYDITTILAGLGIGGLAVALALQDTIKNFIAGLLILADKPFIIGHWVKISDIEGIVEEIGIRSTRIRSFDETLYIIPNSKLLEEVIENLSVRDRRRVLFTIGLTYNTPPEKIKRAKEIILKIIEEHKATLPPYRVHFIEYGDWSLNLRIEYFVRNMGFDYYLNAVEEINLKIKEELEKEGIEIAFPTYTIKVDKYDT
ncbi:MscS Mechanosensitive ion channel [Methanocaldococcus infernus ME]|uniref:MscS Mechanosensitive ion channel n=1 Tax=Methanocaldococcus infernus (strain DSM 11812 / JCM 15783 / ME) TaxID=573063 RepID=D5VT89_METIM|nr:mechanosensitive ion channel family protein [Methanocaldococcus infernus]ADG13792.1 MscS Mechanosensitive ion channel [Methanocaldococcus infernus ME]